MITIKINNQEIKTQENTSILKASLRAGIYIPHLCSHPDLGPIASSVPAGSDWIYQGAIQVKNELQEKELGCNLCLVEIAGPPEADLPKAQGSKKKTASDKSEPALPSGRLQKACEVIVSDGLEASTETERVKQARQENLTKILAEHPHSCLTCAQSEGCSLTQCSSNVPQNERCCSKFGRCELQKVSQYIGISLSTPRYIPKDIPTIETDPLFKRDYNLCIGCLRCVRACRNLRGIDALGFVITDSKIIVGSRKPTLNDSGCKFCGACVEVCPTGAILDKVVIGADRVKSLVPCRGTCPIGMDVPSYIRLIKEDRLEEAFEVISYKVPFPSVLGRVCFHPCEENCRRKEVNEPIAICALKRYATENATTDRFAEFTLRNTEGLTTSSHRFTPINTEASLSNRIAIVGAGPAGLTAAYYLAQKGYPVTVFEANNEIGGMMRYAIPEYRLPLSVLKQDLKKITGHPNITIKTNSTLGKDFTPLESQQPNGLNQNKNPYHTLRTTLTGFTIDSLKKDGFKAILIATGAQLPKKILGDKITTDKVIWGIDFLKGIKHGQFKHSRFGNKSVLVIGGGNVAIDVALSAKRLGAEKVQIICLESRDEMPAHKWEIQQALEEGITLNCCWGPKNICGLSEDKLTLEAIQCTMVFDEAGRFNPSFNENVCDKFQSNIIILAIGQVPNTEWLITTINPNRTIKVDENTTATNLEGIFACGEVAHNPASIIETITDGRKAAENIDKYLGGDGIIDRVLPVPKGNPYFGPAYADASAGRREPVRGIYPASNGTQGKEGFADYKRAPIPCIALTERENNFNPVEIGYSKETAQKEALHCLQCDMRLNISPVVFPPEVSRKGQAKEDLEFTAESIKNVPPKEGVYLLLNENKDIILIKGVINLQEALLEEITKPTRLPRNATMGGQEGKYFQYEIEPMYTKKESELIQQYLQKHGKLPAGGDELEDLY